MMLCTVIWDAYGWGERRAVWDVLRYLLPPDGQRQHWSRKGLYVYWDPATHEMLYTGLATNLSERFAQHTGVIRHSGGNKLANITAWFDEHPHMGFSVSCKLRASSSLTRFIAPASPWGRIRAT